LSETDDTSREWAARIIDAASPLRDALGRRTVTTSEDERRDIDALLEAVERLSDLADRQGHEARHDRLNVIGAVRGYGEILAEDSPTLHPSLASTLPALLLAVESPIVLAKPPAEKKKPRRQIAQDPGVILAVDDLPENRDLVSRLLSKVGHTVITAESGEEALELLETMGVDVVLLDLMMPGITGSEVLQRLKEDDRLRATPVIMISGRQDMDQIVACIEAGADDYLLKPFNPVLLQARISAGIERKRWHDREDQYREQLERRERFIRATFGRYLSDEIVEEILESPEGLDLGGDLREVTIMMSDIRGFTTHVEHLPPQQVVQLLNRYLGRMTDIILEYGGTIDEFLGDAVLAVFGAPKKQSDDTERALRCALTMQAAMGDINLANLDDGLPELDMAIALNTGSVVAGNIGSERRSKYGFVGHAMNVTSRIEDAAGPGEVLISGSTRDKLPDALVVGDRRELSAKGMEEALVVYPLLEVLL
jgi:adenylate cyclase